MDTANKRASAVNVRCPWRGILPFPDSSIDQGDRQTVAFMYAGILATAPAVPPATLTARLSGGVVGSGSIRGGTRLTARTR